MVDSAAARARRARAHRRGDHSECDRSRRCELIEQADANEAVAAAESRPGGRYGPRGQALQASLASSPWVGPLQAELLDEACRVADRLDRLDAALADKGTWLRWERDDAGTVVITIDSVLAEVRQQEMTFRSLLAELDKAWARAEKSAAGRGAPAQPSRKGGGLGDLTAKIAARRDAPAG